MPFIRGVPSSGTARTVATCIMRGSAAAIITQLLVTHSRHRTSPSLTANGSSLTANGQDELAATREQLRLAKADNAALHQRLVDERNGHQVQLESAVCFWKDRADEARQQATSNQQKAGGDEPPGSAGFEAPAAATAALGHSEDLRLWHQQQRTPKRPR